MRLISQDGMVDVPYEHGSLLVGVGKAEEIEHAVIRYNSSSSTNKKLAEYNSKAKVLKVMEMLREQYFNNKHEETYRDGVFSYAPNFKFPADEEIEVQE